MDLRAYFQKIRDVETNIGEPYPVVVSLETADGGKVGTRTEVPRSLAAKLTVDGTARMATPEETRQFQEERAEARRLAEQQAAAAKVQLAVLTTGELEKLRSAGSGKKQAG